MDWKKAIDEVNTTFTYKSDKKNYTVPEVWKFLGKTGEGDCEDYSLTVLWLVSEKNILKFFKLLLTGEYKLHFVKIPSDVGHLVMEHNGMFADNIVKKPVVKEFLQEHYKYKFVYRYIFPHIVIKMGVGFVIGSVVNLFRK